MGQYFKDLFAALAFSAIQGGATATQNNATNFKQVGIAAGLSALLGIVNFVATHPSTSHPSVTAVTNPAQATLPVVMPSVTVS